MARSQLQITRFDSSLVLQEGKKRKQIHHCHENQMLLVLSSYSTKKILLV